MSISTYDPDPLTTQHLVQQVYLDLIFQASKTELFPELVALYRELHQPSSMLFRFPKKQLFILKFQQEQPCVPFISYLLQRCNGILVFLWKFQSCLHFGSVCNNLAIQLAAFLHESLFAFVGFLQGTMKLLVFNTKLVQTFISHKLSQYLQQDKWSLASSQNYLSNHFCYFDELIQ